VINREHAAIAVGTIVIGGVGVGVAASTSETGPILAFIGALLVVLITAYTTDRRQERALNAEQLRLDKGLGEERSRLDLRLQHERSQVDLADLRIVLGDALAANNRARQAAVDGWLVTARREAAHAALQEMETNLDRMRIRLGKDDPLVNAYARMGDAVHALNRLPPPTQPLDHATVATMPEILAWGNAYHEYVDQAQARVGSNLPAVVAD
jgi:hypothetical protein